MKTMGLRHLYLINPRHFPDPQATAMAAGADDILQNAVVCTSIDEALQGVAFTVAMTARLRDISLKVQAPREAMPEVLQRAIAQPVALLFGTEMSGLTNAEMGKAQLGVNIPSHQDFSSLNIAAAVQVISYELSVAAESFAPAELAEFPAATHERLEGLYGQLEKTLYDIGFFTTQNPDRLMKRLRRLYSRSRLEDEEVNLLRGILTKTTEYNARLKRKYIEEHPDV